MTSPLQERNAQLAKLACDLPGSVPYDNVRPINIPARFDGQTLIKCCTGLHPHVDRSQWESWFRQGHILSDGCPVSPELKVRGGQQFQHLFPNTIEPSVNATIRILHEERHWIAIDKPAPLPVHPCGRFNRNSLTSLLKRVYEHDLKLVHRLDANTTGVMVLARDRESATNLRRQFEQNEVEKTYLAKCCGQPKKDRFTIDSAISNEQSQGGGRELDSTGSPAITHFELLKRHNDGTAILTAVPRTGRTNQIRIHLWSADHPIQGDPTYLPRHQRAAKQTLAIDAPPMCLHAWRLGFRPPQSSEMLHLETVQPDWATATSSL